jgi:hypothetical protein
LSSASATSSGPRYAVEPRDIAIRYYSRMRAEGKAARDFVTLLQRTNKRKYENTEYAYQAIKEEIDIQGNKCEDWALYYKQNSNLSSMISRKEDIKRYCDDIETCLREIDNILRSADTYAVQSLHDQLIRLEKIFKNCLAMAERELEDLGVMVQ